MSTAAEALSFAIQSSPAPTTAENLVKRAETFQAFLDKDEEKLVAQLSQHGARLQERIDKAMNRLRQADGFVVNERLRAALIDDLSFHEIVPAAPTPSEP